MVLVSIIFAVVLIWAGYRLYMLCADERETANHNEETREGRRWLAQYEARMREDELQRLGDGFDMRLDEILHGPRYISAGLRAEWRHQPRHTPAPQLNPEWDRIEKLGL